MNAAPDAAERADRIDQARKGVAAVGASALLVTPGGNLQYLTGYRGSSTTERITCLVLVPDRDPVMLVPRLELPLAESSLAAGLQIELRTWADGEDSLNRLVALLPDSARAIAVDDQMWAGRSLGIRQRRPEVDQLSADPVLAPLRMRKSKSELVALEQAAQAIDAVHAQVADSLRVGRTEREVAADIADAILQAGHETAEFVLVASGPNSASPHASPTDRVLRPGEPIVVDIGGRMPSGYNSDCTRTYLLGEPDREFTALYDVLRTAQVAQCEQAAPGITAQDLDAVGRDIIASAGYGEYFVHRTGHGIGLEVHEEPYVVAGSPRPLDEDATFSIEPGIYVPGVGGARIEDIVVCAAGGARRLNQRPRELQVLG